MKVEYDLYYSNELAPTIYNSIQRQEPRNMRWLPMCIGGWLATLAVANSAISQDSAGTVKLTVVEKNSADLIPCRVHLKDRSGRPQRADRLPFWHDHFVCAGTAQLNLAPGQYTYEIQRGPEYTMAAGTITVARKAAVEI